MEQLGQYKILRKLGAGAMGEVYLAEHQLLKVMRALKVLPVELSTSGSFRERFLTEGRVLASLRHPHIVQVHDMGVEDDVHYIAMEFVSPDGRQVWPLDRLLAKSGGRMQPGAAARVLLQVCEAIAYAHEQGVVHCDIKPSNILVVRNNEVCVSDFGLSKVLGQSYLNTSIQASLSGSVGIDQTRVVNTPHAGTDESLGAETTLNGNTSSRAKSLVGTFHYMPPEVQKGQEWTEQGDIYSIGVLTYLLLTGDLPIGRWKLPSQQVPGIDAHWDSVTERALATNPAERFQSVHEVLEGLRTPAVIGHKPVAVRTRAAFLTEAPDSVVDLARDFVEEHHAKWNQQQFLEFVVSIYEEPAHVGLSRESIGAALELEKNAWLEEDARRKTEEARLAEERRKAAEEAERRHKEAEKAQKEIEVVRKVTQEKRQQEQSFTVRAPGIPIQQMPRHQEFRAADTNWLSQNKLLIMFAVLLIMVVLLPLVIQVFRSTGGGGEMGGPPPPGPKAEPLLNATNLAGTTWNLKTPEIPIALTLILNSGGQAVATIPSLFANIARQQLGTDTLTGNWSVQGDKLIVSVNFQGKGFTVECDIIGDKIYYNNKEIPRIQ